jgi:hypothetical protein
VTSRVLKRAESEAGGPLAVDFGDAHAVLLDRFDGRRMAIVMDPIDARLVFARGVRLRLDLDRWQPYL